MDKKRIVILGAGFGGVSAARTLYRFGAGKDFHVTVVDRSPLHVFTPLLYEVAAGFTEHENIGTAKLLHEGVAMSCTSLLARFGADFHEGEVERIDWGVRRVFTNDKTSIPFDALIVALGAETNFYDISGLQEHAFILKTLRDADRLRQRLHDILHTYEKSEKGKKKLNIVIGGGGATGVELAAEITMFFEKHVIKKHIRPEDFLITLVEASPRVLGTLPPTLSEFAQSRLRHLGVRVSLDSAIKEVGHNRVVLVPRACKVGETPDQLLCDFTKEGSKEISSDITIWTGGIKGVSSLQHFDFLCDERGGRVPITHTLELMEQEKKGVFVIGDNSLLVHPKTNQPVPYLAQSAIAMGEVAGENAFWYIEGKDERAEYSFPDFPLVVPLGGKCAVAKLGPILLQGFPAWIIKELANLRYFLSVLPFFSAIIFWIRGIKLYVQND